MPLAGPVARLMPLPAPSPGSCRWPAPSPEWRGRAWRNAGSAGVRGCSMGGMSIAPEQVEAPARDAVLFRSSPLRTFAALFVILLLSYVAVSPVVALIVGSDGDPWWSTALQAVVIAGLVAGGYAFSPRAALTTWVRVSAGGLELAAQGSDPILLAWE